MMLNLAYFLYREIDSGMLCGSSFDVFYWHKIKHNIPQDLVMANIYCQKYCWQALYYTVQFVKRIFHWKLYTGTLKT